jgi:hypothetical protein
MKHPSIARLTVLIAAASLAGLTACGKGESRETAKTPLSADTTPRAEDAAAEGAVVFTANGEDFVRRGFVDKQGWSISFDNLYVNIVDPTAYVPDTGEQVVLEGSHWVDLAEGSAEAEPIVLGSAEQVAPDNYQALRFAVERVSGGFYAGSSIVMVGTASRGGKQVPFTIRLDEEMVFDGREGYVGEELKGLLQPGSVTDVEMTFHFDHVFGDAEAETDDHINAGSVGFDFFYAFADAGVVDVGQEELKGAEGYGTLLQAVWSLGHLGEGHCEVSRQSSLDLL